MGLDLLQALLHFLEAFLALRVRQRTRVLRGPGLLDDLLDLIEVLLVLLDLALVLLDPPLDLLRKSLRLLREIADLVLDCPERLCERRVAAFHQPLQLVHQLLERALHGLGQLLVRLLRLGVAGLGVLLRRLELRARVLAVLLRRLPLTLLHLLQRFLALRDGFLAFAPRLLAEADGFLRRLVERLQLLELLLVLVELDPGLVVQLLRLGVVLLRRLGELADLRLDRLDGLHQGGLALGHHRAQLFDNAAQRVLHALGQIVDDFFELGVAELCLALAGGEVRLRRVDFLRGLVPLLVLAQLDRVLAAVEHRLARGVRLAAVLLDVQAGLDPFAAVLVDRVLDLLFVGFELLFRVLDGPLDLVDRALRLVDEVLQLVADGLLELLGSVLHGLLRARDRVLRLPDRVLREVQRVLRARGDGAGDRLHRRVTGDLDRVHDPAQIPTEPVDERLRAGDGLRRAHLDRALALEQRGRRERHAGLARVHRQLGGGEQRGLDPLHRAREAVADGVHGVERRGLHRVERVLRVLHRLLRDVDDLVGGLVRGLERLLRHVGRRRRSLLRGLRDFSRCLADVALQALQLALDLLQHRRRRVRCARLDLLQRVLHLLPDLLRRIERLRRALRGLARGLQRERRGVLDLVGDRLRLLRGVLQRLGKLAQVLDRRAALLDGVAPGAELGRVAGVDVEQVLRREDVVLPVHALARLLDFDHRAGPDRRISADARLG